MKANMSVGAKHSRSKYELLTNKCIGRQASLLLSSEIWAERSGGLKPRPYRTALQQFNASHSIVALM